MLVQFMTSDTGTFDLTSVGVNDNYASREQCVLVHGDQTDTGSTKRYYPIAGTMDVAAGDPKSGTVSFTLTDVRLVEVTVDVGGTWSSTPVEGGDCLELSGTTSYSTAP